MSNYDHAEFYFKRAETSKKNNQTQKAIELYTEAIKYCTDDLTKRKYLAPSLLARAEIYWDLDNYKKAVEDCNKVIEIAPNRSLAWALRGGSYCKLNEYDKAIDDLKIALEIEPDYIWALQMLSITYERDRKLDLGLQCILQCLKTDSRAGDGEPWNYIQAADICMQLEKYDDAIEYLSSLDKHRLSTATTLSNLGKSYRLRNGPEDLDRALETINKAIEKDHQVGWIWAERGFIYKAKEEYKSAAEDFRKALSYDKSLARVQDLLQECIELSGESIDLQASDSSISNDNLSEKVEYDNVDDNDSDEVEAKKTEMQFRDLIRKNQANVDTYLDFGKFLMKEYKLPESEAMFRHAMQLDPKNKTSYTALIEVLIRQDKPKGAAMAFNLATQQYPDDENIYINLAKLQIDNGFVNEAANICWQAMHKFPDLADAYYYFAKARQGQERWQDAEIAFLQAIEKNPKFVLAYFNLGMVLVHQGRVEEAESAFRRALEIDPDYYLARWNMELMISRKKE